MSDLPKGCFKHINHKCILRKDINNDRPTDQRNISTERAIRHSYIVERRYRFFKPPYWSVFTTTTYEMEGDYKFKMGGRRWAETDLTGLEWKFENEKDAEDFAFNESFN